MMLAFILLGALAIGGGIITIAARNAVHAALGLVGTLLCVAGLFATLNASFLAATQVIVYAGAVMVLFLFVIMLLNANQPVTAMNSGGQRMSFPTLPTTCRNPTMLRNMAPTTAS